VIQKLIKEITESLDEERIPYMIIGGQAVLIYGIPRLTRDIGIALGIDADGFALVEKTCKKLKLKMLPGNPKNFAEETNVLPAEEPTSGIRIDFIFSSSLYETQAIKRAKEIIIDNYPVKFALCEDVIIHKMVAARAVDAEDVKSILIKNKDSIDLEYITGWLLEFSKISEHEGILEGFNRLLK